MSTSNNEKRYFDLHTTGLGYVSRVREVKVNRGQNFVAVDISALHGLSDNVTYTRFDCRVCGFEAEKIIRQLMPDIQTDHRVLIGFKIGDIYPETFTYTSGDKQGQTGVSLKGRLLRIAWAKVDGQTVYTAPKPQDAIAREAA